MSRENGSESTFELEAGQVWRYRTRPGEERSMLMILEIEEQTAHVHLKDIVLTTPSGDEVNELFLPLGLEALRKSVVSRVTDKENPATHRAMVKRWRVLHDTRGQGQFDIALAELLESLAKGESTEV